MPVRNMHLLQSGIQHHSRGRNPACLLAFLACIAVGMYLRLWNWTGQILLDDEWHALNFVLGKSLPDVFLRQGLGANSIPVNVYSWLLLHTVGWSEAMLRLPSMVAGVASLVVVPLLVSRLWGRSVALVACALLSVAPVLIFYSRIARPYAPAMLLACASVLLTLLWLRDRLRRDILLSAVCGALAIYYHLYTAIPVCVPLAVAAAAALVQGRGTATVAKELLPAAGLFLLIVGILVVIPNLINPWWTQDIHGISRATPATAARVLELVAGTPQPAVQFMMLGLMLAGFVFAFRESLVTGIVLTAPLLVFSLAMALTTQDGAHAGIQVVRYGIAFVPIAYIAVARAFVAGLERLSSCITSAGWGTVTLAAFAAAVWIPSLVTSPLWRTYAYPNNFTSHSAFQDHYGETDWQRSPERDLIRGLSIDRHEIPPVYLAEQMKGMPGVIVYPVLVGDHLNIHYYYQKFHGRPVIAGYLNHSTRETPPGTDYVVADHFFDNIMGNIASLSKKHHEWDTMLNLSDGERVRRDFKGWLLVIHRNPLAEIIRDEYPDYPASLQAYQIASTSFGEPVYSDEQVAAWIVK